MEKNQNVKNEKTKKLRNKIDFCLEIYFKYGHFLIKKWPKKKF